MSLLGVAAWAYQGLITIAEYDGGVPGRSNGRVWQRGPDGRTRWTVEGFRGAMSAQALPGNRVLVAENMANMVVEKDQQNVSVWEYQTPSNPIACQRLPNGNTFIATYNQVRCGGHAGQEGRSSLTNVAPGFHLFRAAER